MSGIKIDNNTLLPQVDGDTPQTLRAGHAPPPWQVEESERVGSFRSGGLGSLCTISTSPLGTEAVTSAVEPTKSRYRRMARPSYRDPVIKQIFLAFKKWEGVVLDVEEEIFFARLRALDSGEEAETEFPVNDVSPDDRPLLQPGARFFFSVGRLDRAGTVERCSRIRFRRLPKWSADEVLDARDRAEAFVKRLKIE